MSKYECHITVPMPSGGMLHEFEDIGEDHGWKTSYIQGDPLLGEKRYFYFTRFGTDLMDLANQMSALTNVLRNYDIQVLRQKIEEILFDTKTGHDKIFTGKVGV